MDTELQWEKVKTPGACWLQDTGRVFKVTLNWVRGNGLLQCPPLLKPVCVCVVGGRWLLLPFLTWPLAISFVLNTCLFMALCCVVAAPHVWNLSRPPVPCAAGNPTPGPSPSSWEDSDLVSIRAAYCKGSVCSQHPSSPSAWQDASVQTLWSSRVCLGQGRDTGDQTFRLAFRVTHSLTACYGQAPLKQAPNF